MKSIITVLFFAMGILFYAQENETITEPQPETFELDEAGMKYTMQKYFLVIYTKGETRSQTEEEAAEIQKRHLEHIGFLANNGLVSIAGPMAEDENYRGILIYNLATKEQVIEYTNQDPMVQTGRLEFEIHPVWLAKGSTLK